MEETTLRYAETSHNGPALHSHNWSTSTASHSSLFRHRGIAGWVCRFHPRPVVAKDGVFPALKGAKALRTGPCAILGARHAGETF